MNYLIDRVSAEFVKDDNNFEQNLKCAACHRAILMGSRTKAG